MSVAVEVSVNTPSLHQELRHTDPFGFTIMLHNLSTIVLLL